ncbi:MAG: CHAT domain-containing protein [bacterium]
MRDLLRQLSRDFVAIAASDAAATCLSRLEQESSTWTLIARRHARDEILYYAIESGDLLGMPRTPSWDLDLSLEDLLNLHESDSNAVIMTDGHAFHPRQGPGVHFTGRFSHAAVVLDQNIPIGILGPPIQKANGGERRAPAASNTPARVDTAAGPAETLVDTTIGAEFPDSLAVGETKDLEINLAVGAVELPGTTIVVPLSTGEDVVIRLSLSENLKLATGNPSQTVKVPKAGDPRVLLYKVSAVSVGPARITIRLFQPGRAAEQVGYLDLRPTVTAAPIADTQLLRPVGAAYPASGCTPPDVTLFIEEQPVKDGVQISFRLTAGPSYPDPYEDAEFGTQTLRIDPAIYFQQRFAAIEGLPFETAEHLQAIDFHLRQEGGQLYQDLFSAEIRQEIERNGGRIASIQIKTDGHHIPWEMILLPPAAGATEGEFLAKRYQVTRWTERWSPPAEIHVRDLIYVAPGYEDGGGLRFLDQEVAYLESLQDRGVQPHRVRARPAPFGQAVKAGGFDVFHYVGHASQTAGAMAQSSLELETEIVETAGTQKRIVHSIDPLYLTNLGSTWASRRPLVFLNACQTGRADVGLVRLGGWATAALGSRAGSFVGTLWSVRDGAAYLWASTFYKSLVGGATLGAAALAARRTVAATGDPSWLAYIVYAHPNAKVVVGGA